MDTDTARSCLNCTKEYVCKFRKDPYVGTASDGIMFNISYKQFAKELYELHGKYCAHYMYDGGV